MFKNIFRRHSKIDSTNTETDEEKNLRLLSDSTYDNTKEIFDGDVFTAKVLKVYDGDTIWVSFVLNNEVVKTSIRMDGYDSPELRVSRKIDEDKRQKIKKWGMNARNRLEELLGGCNSDCYVKLVTNGIDCRGRPLGVVYSSKITNKDDNGNFMSVNDVMVTEHHGYKYDGGTKLDQYEYFSQFNVDDCDLVHEM